MDTTEAGITRREFLGLAGGLMILITLPPEILPVAEGAAEAEDINAWLLISPDSTVTVFSGKVELGQGIRTSFAQMVAEELTVPFSSVEMIMGDTDSVPHDRGTFGSLSTRTVGRTLMAAAAKAREILTNMAAEKWGVKPQDVIVKDGRISLAMDPTKSVTLGGLTEGAAIAETLPGEPTLLPVSEHQVIGKPLPRVDGPAIVTGAEKFVGDLRLPGMLYGAVLHPPSFGARLVSMDAGEAEELPGVVAVVREDEFVGVVGERQDIAQRARDSIKATWEETPHPAQATLYDDLRKSGSPEGTVVDDAAALSALAGASRTFNQTYRTSFLAHAPIEPHVALASVTSDGATVWASAQTPFSQRDGVAGALGINPSKVHVFVPRVGGGFGGKESTNMAVMAARLSRAVKRPVLLSWNRAEVLTWNYFKPAALIDVRCGVDGAGRIQAWDCDIYNCGARGAEPPYGFPKHIRTLRCNAPLAQGAWRGLAGSANTFAIESHMDEMASELGVDPVEFRLRHLENNPRLAKTVQAVADKYGWKPRRAPSGQGVGFACAVDAGSCVAEIAEIALDRSTGLLRVRRVVAAMESGLVINPDGITNQMEGAITMGLGMVLREAVRYENGKILTDSFATYRIPTIKDAPAIETVLVDNPTHPPEGAGEPPLFPIAVAVANAFFDATGKRVRQIPLSPETVLAALKA
jgi:nicotinate dehydrogenase subunit B